MAENKNTDSDHMSILQQDAIRRAREMQARARASSFATTQFASEKPPEGRPKPHNEQMPIYSQEDKVKQAPPSNRQPFEGGVLNYLMKDSERTLILVLLVLLVEEKADTELIFALMYLLL